MHRYLATGLVLGLSLAGCKNEYNFPSVTTARVSEPIGDFGQWLSMDTAPDGLRLTLSYYDRTTGAVGYAIGMPLDDGTVRWTHEQVDGYPDATGLDIGDLGGYTSQRTAPDGTVWLAYHDFANGGLVVAHRLGPQTWEISRVDAGAGARPRAGMWSSLALTPDGSPVVAHYDDGSKNLRVSRLSDGTWSTDVAFTATAFEGTDPETGAAITRPASAGTYADLHIHEDGTERIAFYDAAHQNLRMVTRAGGAGAWVPEVIDNEGPTGQWPSIYWSSENVLYVAYHDHGNQRLRLATRSGPGWTLQTIDDGEFVGADTEVFELGGQPAILYFDGRENDQRIARRTGTTWTGAKLAGDDGALGFHNEVTHTSAGTFAASYDYSSRTPRVVRISE